MCVWMGSGGGYHIVSNTALKSTLRIHFTRKFIAKSESKWIYILVTGWHNEIHENAWVTYKNVPALEFSSSNFRMLFVAVRLVFPPKMFVACLVKCSRFWLFRSFIAQFASIMMTARQVQPKINRKLQQTFRMHAQHPMRY